MDKNITIFIKNILRHILRKIFNFHYLEKNNFIFNINDFKKYSIENNISKKYIELIKNLDLKSKIIIDVVLNRILSDKKIIKTYEVSNQELKYMSKNYLFDGKSMNGDVTKDKYYYEYIYPGFKEYELPVFMFHHGLVLISGNVNEYLLKKDCIDGGSSILDSAVVLSLNYPFKQIHSFDLDNRNILQGKKILKKNYSEVKNIKTNLKGLWSKKGGGSVIGDRNNRKLKISNSTKIVELTSIDEYSKINNLNIGYIKLDIEGSEYQAIIGAKKTIQENLPIMSISIYHTLKDFFEIKPLIEEFAPNEYDFYVRKLAPFFPQYETYLICIPKKLKSKLLNFEDLEIFG